MIVQATIGLDILRRQVSVDVGVADIAGRAAISLHIGTEPVHLDENHAQALILSLQAAVAEVQARAVGR